MNDCGLTLGKGIFRILVLYRNQRVKFFQAHVTERLYAGRKLFRSSIGSLSILVSAMISSYLNRGVSPEKKTDALPAKEEIPKMKRRADWLAAPYAQGQALRGHDIKITLPP